MRDRHSRKLLLTSVCRPFGEEFGDGFGTSYEGSHQILWGQGIFRTRAVTTQWGIEFIAKNLQIPTTTLHYPSMAEFISELRRGYDYVGIAFVAPTLHKLLPMVRAIREHAPKAEIILGGYGTALGEELRPYADHICQGEGVAFMRRLLREPEDAPLIQPCLTQEQSLCSVSLGKTGYIFAGLGCPNGCDFCATSHYFRCQHIKILPDGPAILDAIHALRERHPDLTSFWINDEDFLLDEARGRGFLEAIRRSNLPALSLSVFSSVKALSRYTAAELVEMGIDWVWVGYEGQRAGYAKQVGRPFRELLPDLRRHGISTLTSMIIGFDYQTAATIQAEFDELMSLRPSMCQFLIYGPAHGTPSFLRLQAEGRIRHEVYRDHSKRDGFNLCFHHPHIGPAEMSALQRRLYLDEFERLGPSVFRIAEDYLIGYKTLQNHPAPRVRDKAEWYRQTAHRTRALLSASRRYLNTTSAAWLDRLAVEIDAATGPQTARERLRARLAPALLWYTAKRLRHRIGQQPRLERNTFRQEEVGPAPIPEPAIELH